MEISAKNLEPIEEEKKKDNTNYTIMSCISMFKVATDTSLLQFHLFSHALCLMNLAIWLIQFNLVAMSLLVEEISGQQLLLSNPL